MDDEMESDDLAKYKCLKCGTVRTFGSWSDKLRVPLKCFKCEKLTLHEMLEEE